MITLNSFNNITWKIAFLKVIIFKNKLLNYQKPVVHLIFSFNIKIIIFN